MAQRMVLTEIRDGWRMEGGCITVDLDQFDLARDQGCGSSWPIVRVDIIKGGKRVTVHLGLYQHEMKRDPSLRVNVMAKSKDVIREVSVRPWVEVAK